MARAAGRSAKEGKLEYLRKKKNRDGRDVFAEISHRSRLSWQSGHVVTIACAPARTASFIRRPESCAVTSPFVMVELAPQHSVLYCQGTTVAPERHEDDIHPCRVFDIIGRTDPHDPR